MDDGDQNADLLCATAFVVGVVLVPLALLIPPGCIDRWLIQPAWPSLHAVGLAPNAPDPWILAVMRRELWIRLPAMFVGALFVVGNLHLFRNRQRRAPRKDLPAR
jgi:hypothetical protein